MVEKLLIGTTLLLLGGLIAAAANMPWLSLGFMLLAGLGVLTLMASA
jgi:hypothetical protein